MSSLNFLHIRREVKTMGNKPKSFCVRVCTVFEKIYKYIKGNHEYKRGHEKFRFHI